MSTAITLDNLVAYVVQSSALIGAALAALWVLRIDAPGVRYLSLRVTLAAALLLPLLQPRVNLPSEAVLVPSSTLSATPRSEAAATPSVPRLSFDATAIAGGPSPALV